jgi:hypothetical protein
VAGLFQVTLGHVGSLDYCTDVHGRDHTCRWPILLMASARWAQLCADPLAMNTTLVLMAARLPGMRMSVV